MVSYNNKIKLLDNNLNSYDDIIDEEDKNIKINRNEFLNNCNKIYDKISLITKENNFSINKDNIKHSLLNNIKEKLNNNSNFLEEYIKTKEFSCSYNAIKKDYPGYNKLFEYKMLYEHFLGFLKISRHYFDYKGNTISPNSSFNNFRGKEKYDPPYGWFGIGLNINKFGIDKDWIENKSNTSKWAIAYLGVGQLLSNKKVKQKIIDIITQIDLVLSQTQKYRNYKDKRNSGNKIGEGIILTPKINKAEFFAGIININNKQYKIVMMARVLISKIRELEDVEYWILNKDDIRFYRILIKKI